jgi:hypothetical protein
LRVWSGEFDVERRPSWQTRTSERWSGELDLEKFEKDFQMEVHMVDWVDGDVENPLNFASGRKLFIAMFLAFACFVVSIASSGFSQG